MEATISRFSDRLHGLMEAKGLNVSQFARKTGLKKSSIYDYLNKGASPKKEFFVAVKETFADVDLNDLIAGEAGFGESSLQLKEERAVYGEVSSPRRVRVHIAHAGDAIDLTDYEGFLDMEVTEEYPSDEEFGRAAFLVEGDSMSPTIDAGWLLIANRLLDFSDFENGAVYMVLSSGRLQCKRVYLDPENVDVFILSSDNPVFRETTVLRARTKLWKSEQFIGSRNLGGA